MSWNERFTNAILKQGEGYFKENRVADLKQTKSGYEALVQENHSYPVTIVMKDKVLKSMRCSCFVAKGQKNCKHMAAVLFAIEQEWEKKSSQAEQKEEEYRYFDVEKLRQSMELKVREKKRGMAFLEKEEMEITPVHTGYSDRENQLIGEIKAEIADGDQKNQVEIVFDSDTILYKNCNCPSCYSYYRWYGYERENCEHVAALGLYLLEYLEMHNIGDATEKQAYNVIRAFQRKRAKGLLAEEHKNQDELILRPRIHKKDGELNVSFRVGMRNGKLFVIKNMTEFSQMVQTGANGKYGTTTVLNHAMENFSEESKRYVSYIRMVVAEEIEYADHLLGEAGYYYKGSPEIKQSFALFGKRVDDFYDLLETDTVEYEDKDECYSNKAILTCKEGKPSIVLDVKPQKQKKTKLFLGIRVTGHVPSVLSGQKYNYYIEGKYFYRMKQEVSECIMPLIEMSDEDELSFLVGKNQLASFYYTVLPQLMKHVEVRGHDAAEIQKYLQPEVQFVFYLDAEQQNVLCRVCAVYGEQEEEILDVIEQNAEELKVSRDFYREREVYNIVQKYFPCIDSQRKEFHCNGEEEAVYRILTEGLEELLKIGEVKSTDRFRNLNMARKAKVAVGVSVQSGLLNLNISSDDISQEELLEALKSYRLKKKYHRLKNGDFLQLEDENIEMLSELMESLHMTPKEFTAGKMKLPTYRALYLDKMMEQHEDVYTDRDSHFKKLVREFKTVEDSEYEEPESLKKVLRNYQKTGYKWMRTLESNGFGGILADDMGLGKTVQMIAVFLAAKEENRMKTALIVCPASLVFNWGEEIARFAPQLNTCLITGTQEERQKKIAQHEEYDVMVTSYDLLKRDIASYEGIVFDYEVIDEAQYIKNHTTAAAKAVKLVESRNRFALTGTPIENRLSELWSIFDYLMPGFLYRYEVFKREFETQIVKYDNEQAVERLRRMVSPFILRRLKGEVLKDLPEKIEEVRYSKFESEQQKLYDAQVIHMQRKIAEQDPEEFQKNKLEIFKELTRLRQICCDPSLCFENYHGGAAKLDSCLELIDSAIESGHKILLFSQFTTMLAHIRAELDKKNICYYEITGSTPKEKRVQMVKKFNQDDTPLFLISLKAGGTGLNLTGADVVIHYDPWWNVAAQNQATDRAHRIGQTKVVSVYKLIMKHSIEEKILKLQESKQDLADQIISGDVGSMTNLTQEELMELLGVPSAKS